MNDLISRQAAIDIVVFECGKWTGFAKEISKQLKQLPTVQPEPAIPLSWIEKYIEWLKSFDNEFVNLAAAHISVMVKKWRDEQNE